VYITDESSTREITSWALPVPFQALEISKSLAIQYVEAKRRLGNNNQIITSHAVFIVDMSGSMRKSDMIGHRSRYQGAYYAIAEEFLAPQLQRLDYNSLEGIQISFTDVVSVIEMRDTADLVLHCEPLSWILYNKLVQLSEKENAKSHGIYFKSLRCAFKLLSHAHKSCALSLFFLSDGRPSDDLNRAPGALLLDFLSNQCLAYGNRLTFVAHGLGRADTKFDFLHQLVGRAVLSKCGGLFSTGLDGIALRTALSSVITSLQQTRMGLTRLNAEPALDALTSVDFREQFQAALGSGDFNSEEWTIYNSNSTSTGIAHRWILEYVQSDPGCWKPRMKDAPFAHDAATGFAIRRRHFGQGAERIVYRMTELDAQGRPVGSSLVAKQSKHTGRLKRDPAAFHVRFIRTQMKAQKMARNFNMKLAKLEGCVPIPRVEFLSCSVYTYTDGQGKAVAFLAEPCIDSDRYRKWNDNAGRVDGIMGTQRDRFNVFPLDAPDIPGDRGPINNPACADAIDDLDEVESSSVEDEANVTCVPQAAGTAAMILDPDVPQAFSHFTYRYSQRRLLVCDIQGVLDRSAPAEPIYRLTDPCIHYVSARGRRMVHGQTDKGWVGMQDFFKTHACNNLCKCLGLCPK
jgi:hypothetical protein